MPIVAALLFASGLCALVYQVAWLRELRLVFGASTAASSAVVAIFIAGLGAGGLVLGRRAERHPRPLALYAKLEAAIAVAAAVSPGASWLVRKAYVGVGGSAALGALGGTVARVALAALILGPPTFLMGGTLPSAARAIETDDDRGRRGVAWLYGLNTLGAVLGALATTFVLLEVLGTRLTLWTAALLNLLVAVSARAVARGTPELAPSDTAIAASIDERPTRFDARLVLAAAAIVGFVFFLLEMVWYRLLGPILGGSVFTFGLILAVALAGIGVGSAAWAASSRARAPGLVDLAWTCALEALFVALAWAMGDRIALLAASLQPFAGLGFGATVVAWAVVASIVVLPASIVAGAQFPLLIALLGRGRAGVGRDVGIAYAFNTAGATLGALAGGFGLLPAIGANGAYLLSAALLVALAAAVLARAVLAERRRVVVRAAAPALAAVIAIVLLSSTGPTAAWRHTPVGAGRAEILRAGGTNAVIDGLRERRRRVFWEAEGIESSVAMDLTSSISFLVNGKSDGSARADAATQVMGGLVGAALHPGPKRALVIGLGTGSTAGWLAKVPGMEQVDVVELEPAIVEVARACAPVNEGVLANPKVKLAIGDARELLLTARARWDLIFSEPSNPYRAGIASLFTQEAYRAALDRLSPDGVYLQWVQGYEIDARTVRTVLATMASVFPSVEVWMLRSNDLLLVGSQKPIVHDVERVRAKVEAEPLRSALAWTWGVSGVDAFYGHFVAGPGLAKAVLAAQGDDLNTDDRTVIEFGLARSVGHARVFDPSELRAIAARRGDDRPALVGAIDPERALDARFVAIAREGDPVVVPPGLPAPAQRRAFAFARWVAGDLEGAAAAWQAQPRAPTLPLELLAVGEALAETKDERALSIADALRAFQPVEADVIVARLRLAQGRVDEAAPLLERALVRYRDDPWPHELAMQRALELARSIAERDPSSASRMWAALDRPFAAYGSEEQRRLIRTSLVQLPALRGHCVEALAPFEPHTPWERAFLTLRRDCYVGRNDPRAALAESELVAFLAGEPLPFGAGLLPAP